MTFTDSVWSRMNSHRAGVIFPGKTKPKMIASGSREFCEDAVVNHDRKNPGNSNEYIVHIATEVGKPAGWSAE